jgi:membrane glycosyltransferase
MDQNIYPNVPTQNDVILSEEDTKKLFDKKLNEERIKHMNLEYETLKTNLKHYTKLKKKWDKIDIGFKITGITIISITGITAAICGTVVGPLLVPLLAPAVPIVLGVISASESVLLSSIVMGLTTRKKKKFNSKCKLIQSYLDKLYYYIEQSKQDHIITLDEIHGFENIINEYKNEIEKINEHHDEQSKVLTDHQMKKITEEANKEFQKLYKQDLKKEIIQSQYNAVSLQRRNV